MALSGVTDAYGKGTEHADKMRATTKTIASMLRTWSGKLTSQHIIKILLVTSVVGLMYFCVHDKLALRAVVDGLRIPSLQTRVCRLA